MTQNIGNISDHLDYQIVAADPTQSVWVSANAGTGKTHVLVNRMLRLLLAGIRPGRILCLTFTKAAAAEMANRLNSILGSWAVMSPEELVKNLESLLGKQADDTHILTARRLFAQALEVPEGLKIRTIHSFCESLLGRFPLEAGIAPHFSVIDERTAAELRLEARDRILIKAFSGQEPELGLALQHISSLVSEDDFASVMSELDGKRNRVEALINSHGDIAGVISTTRKRLGLGPNDTLISVMTNHAGLDEEGLRAAASALTHGTKTDRGRVDPLLQWLNTPDQRDLFFHLYADLFLTQSGTPRKNMLTKAAKEADPNAEDVMNREADRLIAILEKLKAIHIIENTQALLTLGQALLNSYRDLKDIRALVDYDDLILKTRSLLGMGGGISWVHFKLDGGIEHILVDEAQDTSPEQWDVIRFLSEEFFTGEGASDQNSPISRTIFAVGDEKQSIYSFQGADPARFDQMRQFFARKVPQAGKNWKKVDMALSFRSTWSLLGSVDQTFAPEAAADGLSSDSAPIRHLSYRAGQAGLVELWPTVTPSDQVDTSPWETPVDQLHENSPEMVVADRIAIQIENWLERQEILPSTGRPIRPSDIMILVRKRSAFAEEMIRRLKEKNIPVAGSDRMVLTDQLAVMDMIAIGQFALLPDDDLNLAIVLKSPFIGLDDNDLIALAPKRTGSLWQALRDNPHYARVLARLKSILDRADFTPPYEFFSRLLGPEGGRKALLKRLGPDAADPINEFLSLALNYEQEHTPSMQGFLHWVEAGETQIKRDLEHGRQEVRVMTVHGSKGLQANIVFLPDTCTLPNPGTRARMYWNNIEVIDNDDAEDFLLWPAIADNEESVCKALREKALIASNQEYRRLLYVAMTRSRDRLYVCGWETSRGRGEGCWYDLIAPDLLENGEEVELPFGETGWRLSSKQTEPAEKSPSTGAEAGPDIPLPAWVNAPKPEEPVPPKPLAPSRPEQEDPPVRTPLGTDNGLRFRRGLLVHKLLQFLPDVSPDNRARTAADFLALPAHGLSEAEQIEIATETITVLDHPDFAPLFGPGSRAEVSLVGNIPSRSGAAPQTISAQIDRLLVTEESVLIIDYKTNRPPPAVASDVPVQYLRQMASYRAALEQIYPNRPVHTMLLWTDGPTLMPLPDDILNHYLP